MDIRASLSALGGVAPAGALRSGGFSRQAIAGAVAAGVIVRCRKGHYALPDAPADLRTAAMAGARLTCVSAAGRIGLGLLHTPTALHLAVASGRRSVPCVRHRTPTRGGSEYIVRPIDCVVHGLHCLPRLDALVLAESAVRNGLVGLDELLARLPGPTNGPAREIAADIDPYSGSVLETVARKGFLDAGLSVRTQVRIDRVGRVDFLIDDRLIVEVDGYDFHSDHRAFADDRHRSNIALECGLPTLRFTYADIMWRIDGVIAQIKQVLGRTARS